MVPTDNNHFTAFADLLDKFASLKARRVILHKIAEDDKTRRFVVGHQLQQSLRDGIHAPKGDEPSCRAPAQLVAKMQIGNGEPFFLFVKKCEPSVQQHIICYTRLTR